MSNWPTGKLGDVAEFVRGINFKPDDVVPVGTDGSVVCMRTKNVQAELDCSDVWAVDKRFVARPDQFLKKGDLLVSSANSWNLVGKCCWIPELPWRATFGGFVSVLRRRNGNVHPRYLYHWFGSPRIQTTLRSFGQQTTNISNLNTERCLQLAVPLPPLEEQRRIADILDRTEALRAKRRAALAQLDTLTQSIFLNLFGERERNPKNYPLVALGDCVQLKGGFAFRSDDYVPDGIPLIRIGEVNRGSIRTDGACFLPRSYKTLHSRFLVRPGNLLMSLTGTTGKDDYGNVIILDNTFDEYFLNQRVALLQPDNKLLDKTFLYHLLRQPRMKSKLTTKSRGIRQANISNGDVLELKFPLPALTVQQYFASRVEAVEKVKSTQSTSLARLDSLFAILQHHVFRGEL